MKYCVGVSFVRFCFSIIFELLVWIELTNRFFCKLQTHTYTLIDAKYNIQFPIIQAATDMNLVMCGMQLLQGEFDAQILSHCVIILMKVLVYYMIEIILVFYKIFSVSKCNNNNYMMSGALALPYKDWVSINQLVLQLYVIVVPTNERLLGDKRKGKEKPREFSRIYI